MIETRRRTSRAKSSVNGRTLVFYFLAWTLPPLLFRAAVWRFRLYGPTPVSTLSSQAAGLALSVAQDLSVAAQALLLGLAASWLWRRSSAVFGAVTSVLFAACMGYAVADLLLFWNFGIRLNLEFLEYVRWSGSFESSVQAMDLSPLWIGWALVLGAALSMGALLSRRPTLLEVSVCRVLLLGLCVLAGPLVTVATPSGVAYYAGSPVFNDQRTLLLYGLEGMRERRAWPDAALAPPPMAAFSRAERFERVDPDYPLLKETKGFSGEKAFDLRIGPEERPHVVVLFMESFRAADVGVLGGRHGASPEFDSLASRGILFSRFYANGVQTTRGVLAALYGILPRFSHRSVQAGAPDIPLIGLPDLFKRRGYETAFIHGGSLAFENQDRFLAGHGMDEVCGVERIGEAFPSASRLSWGIHDEYIMRYAADWIRRRDRQGVPSFVTILTVTNHHPWEPPAGWKPCSTPNHAVGEHARFLESFRYSDHCLGLFRDLLKETGLAERTILFILADTAQPMGEHGQNHLLLNHAFEENLRIPLLIAAEGRVKTPTVIDQVGSQADLLPTVMDLFHMTGINHAVGTSLVRRVPHRTVFFNNPFSVGYWGFRRNDRKYIYCVDTRRHLLFDLAADPRERTDLSGRRPAESERCHALASGVHRLFEHLYAERRFAPVRRSQGE